MKLFSIELLTESFGDVSRDYGLNWVKCIEIKQLYLLEVSVYLSQVV